VNIPQQNQAKHTIQKDTISIPFMKLDNDAKPPTRATKGSAEMDLFALKNYSILPNQRMAISTGIAMEIPANMYGRIAARSGFTIKHNIDIGAGIIDSDYSGDTQPCIINNGTETFNILKHDKIAQIIFEKCSVNDIYEIADLTKTKQNKGGFGSSDIPKLPSTQQIKEPPTNYKLSQIQRASQKVTIKLPWNEDFEKGNISKHNNSFQFKSLENNSTTIISTDTIRQMVANNTLLIGYNYLITKAHAHTRIDAPPLRVIDKPLSTATSKASYTINQIKQTFGFRNVSSILKELQQTATNFSISTKERELVLDLGEVASMDMPKGNTTPKPLPKHLGDVVHMDIIFGSGIAIGGVKYALFCVDRAKRHKYIYIYIYIQSKTFAKTLSHPFKNL